MTEAKAIDYSLSDTDTKELLASVLLPADIRHELLTQYRRKHGGEALVNLFAQFIGLANSVIANNREMIEVFLITDAGYDPYTAEKANLPTLFGALSGIALAAGVDQSKTCGGCAFRLGTSANQSPCTTIDADWCSHPGEPDFMCHEDLDAKRNPKRKCTGYTQFKRKRAKILAA